MRYAVIVAKDATTRESHARATFTIRRLTVEREDRPSVVQFVVEVIIVSLLIAAIIVLTEIFTKAIVWGLYYMRVAYLRIRHKVAQWKRGR